MTWVVWAAAAAAWIVVVVLLERAVCGPGRCPGPTDRATTDQWWSVRC